jgi:hypothetical protein
MSRVSGAVAVRYSQTQGAKARSTACIQQYMQPWTECTKPLRLDRAVGALECQEGFKCSLMQKSYSMALTARESVMPRGRSPKKRIKGASLSTERPFRERPVSLLSCDRILHLMPVGMIGHDAVALDKVQDSLQVQADGALPALNMLDAPPPARARRGPFPPEAQDEGASRWNGQWLSHNDLLPGPRGERRDPGPGALFRAQGHAQNEAIASSSAWRMGV